MVASWLRCRESENICTTHEEVGANKSCSLSQRERVRVRENSTPKRIAQLFPSLSEARFLNACQPTDA